MLCVQRFSAEQLVNKSRTSRSIYLAEVIFRRAKKPGMLVETQVKN